MDKGCPSLDPRAFADTVSPHFQRVKGFRPGAKRPLMNSCPTRFRLAASIPVVIVFYLLKRKRW
jgi:hypothetical protein